LTQLQKTSTEGFINRDRKEIIGLLLTLIKETPDIKRTKLQFAAYLSSKQMVYFTEEMEKAGLLELEKNENGKNTGFTVTTKGEKYLRVWAELRNLLTS
jgi:predicted transcriptional regulator